MKIIYDVINFFQIVVALLSIFLESLKNLKSRFSEHFYSLPLVKSELEGKEEQGKTSDLVITDSLKYVKSQRYILFFTVKNKERCSYSYWFLQKTRSQAIL